jgi:glycosyltransferase involved in cell wall biosynthesis
MVLNKNKLIYVLNNYSVNSTEHFFHVLNLLEEIANNGVEILLIIEKSDGKPLIKSPNIKVICLKNTGFRRLVELYDLIGKSQKDNYLKLFVRISNWAAVVAIVKSFFSKLEVYYWHSGTVFEFDDKEPMSFSKLKWYFKTRIPFNFIKKNVTYFVTGPESIKNYYIDKVGVKSEKIKILYNDIDVSRFSILEDDAKKIIKKELNINSQKKVILFVHNFSPVRNTKSYVANFLDKFFATSDLHNYEFYFIGGGKEREEIEAQAMAMGLKDKVFFLGSLPNNKVHKYYQVADIFINPTAAEGFPRVLIEAMACGLPIVTTNAGGIIDILGSKQLEYMSDIADPNGFADNLIKIARLSKDELYKLKEENTLRIKNYSTEKVALMYIKTLFDD